MRERSSEYLAEADRFLSAARVLLDANIPENSAAESYQAMLCAAKAALSEVDREAKTHKGTWSQFDAFYVRTERFDASLRRAARDAEELRYDSDYRLGGANHEQAETTLEAAERFVAAIRDMTR